VIVAAQPLDDLTAAVAAARGDRDAIGDVLTSVRERATARAPDDLRARVQAIFGRSPGEGAASRPLPPATDRSVEARLTRQEAAIHRLVAAHEALGRRIEALQGQANDQVSRLLEALKALDLRSRTLTTRAAHAAAATRVTEVRVARQQRELRSALMNARLERVSSVVHATQRAAFGQKGSVFATNNLLLAGNELFWTFVGPTLRALGAISETSATVAAMIAPVGALATGQLALGDRQTERFVFGASAFDGTSRVIRQSLRPFVAPGLVGALERGPNLTVQVTPVDRINGRLEAIVRGGVLIISIDTDTDNPPPAGRRVAWMVDLEPIIG
jgi:hypothetical protein